MWPFAGRKPLTCFYCLKEIKDSSHFKPYNWRCPECFQVNQRHPDGEIVTDHPAMSNVLLNHPSWQRRASVPDTAFPPGPKWSPFCTQCVTNQKLIYEMLANYLPDESDPNYQTLLANAPAKRKDLETRYPPLCEECRPLVEAELRKNHDLATAEIRTASYLSKKPDSPQKDPPARGSTVLGVSPVWITLWRIRGFLWLLSIVLSVGRAVMVLSHSADAPTSTDRVYTLSTILWTTWDPMWLRSQKYRQARLPIRVRGRTMWIINQVLIFLLRVFRMFLLDAAIEWLSMQQPYRFSCFVAGLALALEILANGVIRHLVLRISISKSVRPIRPAHLAPIPKAPSRHSASDDLISDLRLSDSPLLSFRKSDPPAQQTSFSAPQSLSSSWERVSPPRRPVTPPRSRQRPSPIVITPPQTVSPFEMRSPAVSEPSPPEEHPSRPGFPSKDDEMDWEPTVEGAPTDDRDAWQRPDLLRPRTFPNRHTATGLEDLLTSWNLGDSDTPRERDQFQDPISRAFDSWAGLRMADVCKVIALLIGYTAGQDQAVKAAWAFVGVLSTYRLTERRRWPTLLVIMICFGRAILPLPLLAHVWNSSSRKETLLWDAVCMLCIVPLSIA